MDMVISKASSPSNRTLPTVQGRLHTKRVQPYHRGLALHHLQKGRKGQCRLLSLGSGEEVRGGRRMVVRGGEGEVGRQELVPQRRNVEGRQAEGASGPCLSSHH